MKSRRGVTLLELMFALTVLALVSAIGTATLSLLTDDRLHRGSIARLEHESAERRALVAWLEQAHASLGGTFQLVSSTRHNRDADVLTFTTTAATPLGTPETTIRLFVEDDRRRETGLIAELSSWPGGPTARVEIDSTIVGLRVRCLTTLLGGRQWVASWMSSAVVPLGIELRFAGAPNGALPPLLRRPIVAALEGGR